MRIQSVQLIRSEQIWLVILGFIKLVFGLSILASLFACAEYVLSVYPWTRPLSERGLTLILDPLRKMESSVLSAVPNLIFIAILVLIVRYVLKLARLLFAGLAIGSVRLADFDQEWAWPTYRIFRFAVIAFAVLVAYPHIPGAGSEAFKGVSIFLGVLFSFGSTSSVSNTIPGYAIVYRRVFKVGDRVKIGEHLGDVVEMRMQVTNLRSVKNEEIIVPNSEIMNSHVINYSPLARQRGLILHTTVGIGYETPWRQVEAMLLIAVERTKGLLREPEFFVLQTALGDFCVTYETNVYCDQPQAGPRLYTELHRNILDVFNEYGVQIMTPAYVGDTEQAKVVTRDKWFELPARVPEETGNRGDSNTR